ncbi:MAG: DUF6572 domain-containing protein [Chthoniobacterales bacterium]
MNQQTDNNCQQRTINSELPLHSKGSDCCSPLPSGLEKTGTLDAFVHDKQKDLLVLAMFELRPWDLGEMQLFQLQEKLNAYLSFILDGEMEETFPHLKEKPVCIELRSLYKPSEQALGFIERAREQLSHQRIDLQVVLIEEQFDREGCAESGCCGGVSLSDSSTCCQGDSSKRCCQE